MKKKVQAPPPFQGGYDGRGALPKDWRPPVKAASKSKKRGR